jgi:hypothetical protein
VPDIVPGSDKIDYVNFSLKLLIYLWNYRYKGVRMVINYPLMGFLGLRGGTPGAWESQAGRGGAPLKVRLIFLSDS